MHSATPTLRYAGLLKLYEQKEEKTHTLVATVYRPLSADYKYYDNLVDNIESVYADDNVNLMLWAI